MNQEGKTPSKKKNETKSLSTKATRAKKKDRLKATRAKEPNDDQPESQVAGPCLLLDSAPVSRRETGPLDLIRGKSLTKSAKTASKAAPQDPSGKTEHLAASTDTLPPEGQATKAVQKEKGVHQDPAFSENENPLQGTTGAKSGSVTTGATENVEAALQAPAETGKPEDASINGEISALQQKAEMRKESPATSDDAESEVSDLEEITQRILKGTQPSRKAVYDQQVAEARLARDVARRYAEEQASEGFKVSNEVAKNDAEENDRTLRSRSGVHRLGRRW
jgi:hypothetical protein